MNAVVIKLSCENVYCNDSMFLVIALRTHGLASAPKNRDKDSQPSSSKRRAVAHIKAGFISMN